VLQICVQGIPWKYTWKELKDMFAELGEVAHADVMFSPDGRSKVSRSHFAQGSQQHFSSVAVSRC
jgi:RNA recognition motif-containing protein